MKPFTGYPVIVAAGAKITTGASTANAAIPNDSAGNVPRYIRVSATAAASIRLGKDNTVTAASTDTMLQPGDAVTLAVPGGLTYIAAIQQTAAGVVQVSPLENE